MGAETATRGKARASERGRERETAPSGDSRSHAHTHKRAHTHTSPCATQQQPASSQQQQQQPPPSLPGDRAESLGDSRGRSHPPSFISGNSSSVLWGFLGSFSPPPPSPSAIVVPVVYLGLWQSESVATFLGEGAGSWSLLRQWRWLGVPSDSLPPPLPPNPLSLPPSLTRLPRRSQPRVNG